MLMSWKYFLREYFLKNWIIFVFEIFLIYLNYFFCNYDNFDIFVHHHNNAQKSMLKKYFSYFINRFRIVWTCSTRLEQIFFCLHDYVMSLTLENLIVKNKSTRFKFICWSSSHFLLIIVCFFSFSTKHFKEKENDHRFSQA